MTNHYRVLGLNPTGKNEKGEYYSETEIKKFYIKQSLIWHPDKNHLPEATKKFAQLNEAYNFLMDMSKRDAFNNELAQNPSLSKDENKDLFVQISPSSLKEEKTQQASPTPVKEFNLTQYIANAHADIVSVASNDFYLAKALFNNGKLVSSLSLENQYELIILIIDHATKRGEQEWLVNDFSKQIAAYINNLKNDTPHQDAFINACIRRLELVPSIINSAYSSILADIAPFTFYRFALKSESVVDLFMQMHSHFLDLVQLLALKEAQPNMDILGLYKKNVAKTLIKKQKLIL